MTTIDKKAIAHYTSSPFPANNWPDLIVGEARNWVNTPFRHAGRDRRGIDCVGLPIKILHFLGLTEWDDTDYSRSVNPDRMRQEIEWFCYRVEGGYESAQKGDLFWFNICGATQHVGVYTGNSLIHAYETVGKVVEHPMNSKWINRIESVYRLTGID